MPSTLACDEGLRQAMELPNVRALKVGMDPRRPRLTLAELVVPGDSLGADVETLKQELTAECIILIRFKDGEGPLSSALDSDWVAVTVIPEGLEAGPRATWESAASAVADAMPEHRLLGLTVAEPGELTVEAVVQKAQEVLALPLPQEVLKRMAGYRAVDDYVTSGMVIGLGTGSTAKYAVDRVGQKLASGELKDIVAIPTSVRTQEQAASLGIPLATLNEHSNLDVAIDGADNVDPAFNLTKGGGGALFREKIVEQRAKTFVVIVDESKLCDGLGPGFPIPVEIVPFCHEHTIRTIAKLPALAGCEPILRRGNVSNNKQDGEEIAVTDNGNYIVDLKFSAPLKDPVAAGQQLKRTVGVMEHGLFSGMTTACIIAGTGGIVVKTP